MCNGTLYCDKTVKKGKVNPVTVVKCPYAADTTCAVHTCQPKTGQRRALAVNENVACQEDGDCTVNDDGDLCNGLLYCNLANKQFKCEPNPGSVVPCSTAKDGPCAVSQCSANSGKCIQAAKDQGKACNDGLACTSSDVCADGACAGAASVCDDKDPCTTDTCDPVTGACGFKPATCDDGDACTTDSCSAKGCASVAVSAGGTCDDGNACTTSDVCSSGKCVGNSLVCADTNTCTTDSCDKAGGCVFKALPDGQGCNDNSACTDDSCDVKLGCMAKANFAYCSDGTGCTQFDTCSETVCSGANPVVCQDGVPCTIDACDPKTGKCTYVLDVALCDDGDACTLDTCDLVTKACSHGVAADGTSCGNGLGCWNGQCAWARQIAAGSQHACALRTTGTVACWGRADFGQLGDNTSGELPDKTPEHKTGAVAVYSLVDVVSIAAGGNGTCAVKKDGTLWCWGNNGAGLQALGTGSTASFVAIPGQVVGLDQVVAASVSPSHRCALRKDGSVWCWGAGGNGELGTGQTVATTKATPGLLKGASGLGVGDRHSCAILTNGTVQCVGWNTAGQIGDGGKAVPDAQTPATVQGGDGIVEIGGGERHTCGRTAVGAVLCWGQNAWGQIGNNTKIGDANSSFPVATAHAGVKDATDLANGPNQACAVRKNGTVACWGANVDGQLGDGGAGMTGAAVTVQGMAAAVQVATGKDFSCALNKFGEVCCWGVGTFGQFGNGNSGIGIDSGRAVKVTASLAPGFGKCKLAGSCADGDPCTQDVCDGEGVCQHPPASNGTACGTSSACVGGVCRWATAIVGGAGHTCALQATGGVACWGRNTEGQLGIGAKGSLKAVPEAVTIISDAMDLAAFGNTTCAVRANKTVACWGSNVYGQIGNGQSGGTVECWGYSDGILGRGNGTSSATTAGPVLDLANATDIANATSVAQCALSGGLVRCWIGTNFQWGLAGDGTDLAPMKPGPLVSFLSDVRSVAGTQANICAVLQDRTVACWGYSPQGALGLGTLNGAAKRPVRVDGVDQVAKLAGGHTPMCALRLDGSAACWVFNDYGQLRDQNPTNAAHPAPHLLKDSLP